MKFKLSFPTTALSPFTFQWNEWIKPSRWLLAGVVASLPLQLNVFVHALEWGRGFANPYTSIFFSLTELLLLLTGLAFFIERKWQGKTIETGDSNSFLLVLSILSAAGLSSFLNASTDPWFQVFLFTKFLSLLLFYILLVNKILSIQILLRIFIYALCVEALWSFLQVIFQSDFELQILGEPLLASNNPHLARFSIFSMSILRGYGSFSHPNILGGFLSISLLSTFALEPKFKHEKILLFILQGLGLFSSFSRSAALAFIVGLLVLTAVHKEKKQILLLAAGSTVGLAGLFFLRGFQFMKDANTLERLESYQMAARLFWNHPWGVGFTGFTRAVEEVSTKPLMPWEYQPLHNSFLLALVELGLPLFLFCLIMAGLYLYKLRGRKIQVLFIAWFLSLGIVGLFDHYLISLDQGRLLLIFLCGISTLALVPQEGSTDEQKSG